MLILAIMGFGVDFLTFANQHTTQMMLRLMLLVLQVFGHKPHDKLHSDLVMALDERSRGLKRSVK